MQKTQGSTPRSGRSPERGNGNTLRILAWRSPWTEEPGGLQSMGSQIVEHDWAGSICLPSILCMDLPQFNRFLTDMWFHLSYYFTSTQNKLMIQWEWGSLSGDRVPSQGLMCQTGLSPSVLNWHQEKELMRYHGIIQCRLNWEIFRRPEFWPQFCKDQLCDTGQVSSPICASSSGISQWHSTVP